MVFLKYLEYQDVKNACDYLNTQITLLCFSEEA